MGEHAFVGQQTLRNISIEEEEAEEPERTVSDLEPTGGSGGDLDPPGNPDDQISPAPSSAGAADSDPSDQKPVPRSRRKLSAPDVGPEDSPAAPQPSPTPSQASPTHQASTPSTSTHQSPSHGSRPAAANVPVPPPPPPLPMKWSISKKRHTKPFHWDVVAPDKVNIAAPLGPGRCLRVVKVRKSQRFCRFDTNSHPKSTFRCVQIYQIDEKENSCVTRRVLWLIFNLVPRKRRRVYRRFRLGFTSLSCFHQFQESFAPFWLFCSVQSDYVATVLDEFISPQIEKSFWMQRSSRRIEINTARLIEQFSVKDLGTLAVPEPSNGQQIMLNQKIAHNFSE